MGSIRKRLLVALLAAVAVAAIGGSWFIYRNALAEADTFFDNELREIAMSLRDQDFGYAVPEALREARVQFDFVVQVWSVEGRRIYLSQPHPTLPALGRLGYSSTPTPEGTWRTFTVQMRGQVIQVSQPEKVRSRLATSLAFRTLSPFMLVMPLLGIAASLITAWGLRPLEDVTRAIGKRDPQALAPLPAAGHPAEIQPLVASLNALLDRLGTALDGDVVQVGDDAAGEFGKVDRGESRCHGVGLLAGERQQLLHQARRALDAGGESLERGLTVGVGRGALRKLKLQLESGERRAQLMRGVGHETALGVERRAETVEQRVERSHKRLDLGRVPGRG